MGGASSSAEKYKEIEGWLQEASEDDIQAPLSNLDHASQEKVKRIVAQSGKTQQSDRTDESSQHYTHLQYIAIEINTMPHGFGTKSSRDDWYIGLSDPEEDIAARVRLLGAAIKKAASSSNIDASALKLVIIPEFFFRGRKGAHELKTVMGDPMTGAESLERQLIDLVLDAKFKDWIFVFGTIVGYKQLPVESTQRFDYEVYNLSLIQKGGCLNVTEALRPSNSTAVIKQFKSNIDFLQDARFGGLADEDVRHVLRPIEELAVQGDQQDKLDLDDDGIFTMAGVRFGLEICLDHAVGKLKKVIGKEDPATENKLQVQIVPSGGMTLKKESICVMNGGFALLCDGLVDESRRYGAHSEVIVVDENGEHNPVTALEHFISLDGDWKAAMQSLFNIAIDFAPRTSVYKPIPLPKK